MTQTRLLEKSSARKAMDILKATYPKAHYYLDFSTPIDLLVAAILSAQTKDTVVNSVTSALFKSYKSTKDYASADEKKLLSFVAKVAFANAKVKNIIKTCQIIEEQCDGKVPNDMASLLALPGVGRKTANTVLINAFGIVEGIPVDTWVIKLSYRIGFSDKTKPEDIERDLMALVERKDWAKLAYIMKSHGHEICHSTFPLCSRCVIKDLCPKNGVLNSK